MQEDILREQGEIMIMTRVLGILDKPMIQTRGTVIRTFKSVFLMIPVSQDLAHSRIKATRIEVSVEIVVTQRLMPPSILVLKCRLNEVSWTQ